MLGAFLERLKSLNSIRYRIMLYLLAFGLLTTFILSAINIYFGYQSDIDDLHAQFEQIDNSFSEGISNSLWSFNGDLTQIQIEGIGALPNIAYVGITTNTVISAETGSIEGLSSSDLVTEEYELSYEYLEQLQVVGNLSVIADISSIRANAINRLGSVLLVEGVSVALIVLFMSVLMNRMILRHVAKISGYIHEITQQVTSPPLQLDRSDSEANNLDELDVLVSAFNELQEERRKANIALSMSEEKFSKAFHSSPQIFIITSLEDGSIIEVNDAFMRLGGWDREDVIGKTTLDLNLWPSQERDTLMNEIKTHGSVKDVERSFKTKSGEIRLGRLSAQIIEIADDACFLAIIDDITDRKKDEEEILESRERLRSLAKRLEEVREEERSGIARELHDELGQSLTGLKIDLVSLSGRIPTLEYTDNLITNMVQNIDSTVDVVRRISSELRPPVLDDLGLEAAIEWLTTGFSERTGLACKLQLHCDELPLDKAWDTAIFRIYQESLVNIARHSGAKSFEAEVQIVDNALYVRIKDDGIGITQEQIDHSTSIGLLGMQERAAHIGATLTVGNAASGGTEVTLIAPLLRP